MQRTREKEDACLRSKEARQGGCTPVVVVVPKLHPCVSLVYALRRLYESYYDERPQADV
jgi:hypothetical protein